MNYLIFKFKKRILLVLTLLIILVMVGCGNSNNSINKFFINERQGEAPQDGLYLAPVKIGIYWGYMDQNGNIVIEPKYTKAMTFSHNLALVGTEEGYKFIDKNGETILPLENIQSAKPFSEGLACVRRNGKWGYIDINGEFVIEPQYALAESFSEGFAVASLNGIKNGYINKEGIFAIEPKYELALPFSEGMAYVYPYSHENDPANKNAYIGYDGNLVLKPQHPGYRYDSFSEGLSVVYHAESLRYGYMDKNGEIVIEPIYSMAYPFKSGLAAVKIGYNWQYIDEEGSIVIADSDFRVVGNYSEGIAAVMIKNQWGFIDIDGRLLIDCKLGEVGNFSKVN